MKHVLIIFVFLVLSIDISAQTQRHEFGFAAGGSYYLGDINHLKQFYKVQPAFGILYRYTQNDFIAVKAQVLRLTLAADDADFSYQYQTVRNASFKTNLIETSGTCEYHFLPYNPSEGFKFAPYISAGIALNYADNLNNLTYFMAIPFGGGVKAALGKRFTLNVEWLFRNTMSDNLDDLKGNEANVDYPLHSSKQVTSINTNDWYSVAQFSLTYSFSTKKVWCPAYTKKKY